MVPWWKRGAKTFLPPVYKDYRKTFYEGGSGSRPFGKAQSLTPMVRLNCRMAANWRDHSWKQSAG